MNMGRIVNFVSGFDELLVALLAMLLLGHLIFSGHFMFLLKKKMVQQEAKTANLNRRISHLEKKLD